MIQMIQYLFVTLLVSYYDA